MLLWPHYNPASAKIIQPTFRVHKLPWCLVTTAKIQHTTLTHSRAFIKNQLVKLFPQIQMGLHTLFKEYIATKILRMFILVYTYRKAYKLMKHHNMIVAKIQHMASTQILINNSCKESRTYIVQCT